MKRFIYNTQGTGISHEQIRRLERTQPGAGTYIGADMSDGHPLGDEIMLLEGIDDLADNPLAGLGFVGSGNYVSRGYDMSEFSTSMHELPAERRAGRDFNPFGLGSSPARGRAGRDFNPYGLGQSTLERRRREVSRFGARKRARPDLFIGPSFLPFGGERLESLSTGAETYPGTPGPETFFASAHAGNTEPYERWEGTPRPGSWLNGLGDVASDRATAMAIANAGKEFCMLPCTAADISTQERATCRGACNAAYATAVVAITAGYGAPGSGAPPPSPAAAAAIQAKLDALQAEADARHEDPGQPPVAGGMSTTTMVLIGGAALLGVGLIVVLATRR